MGNSKKIGALNIAVLYVGCMMGAGFASGRETWQFFGVFDKWGILGVGLFAVIILAIGYMTIYIANTLGTNDLGKIMIPEGHPGLEKLCGNLMAGMLSIVIVLMTSAGGALLNQQFGLPSFVGGLIIVVLVLATVMGNFARVSRVFKYVMPVLCIAMILTCLAVIITFDGPARVPEKFDISPMTPNWIVSTFLYVAYNVIGLIAIMATAAINAKSYKTTKIGALLGGTAVGVLAMLILLTIRCDMVFSQGMDMPVLGYADNLSKGMGVLYTIILFCAIYSTATSNYYGFTTKIKEGPKKNFIVVITAFVGYLLGLVGFKNIISYLTPVIGYIGLIFIGLLVWNFISLIIKEHKDEDKSLS
ncbi:MAG: hypothetical protein IJP00_07230 [Firmicutes bacterium]|nr:hypothetical protein [Bacillota bacterium]